MSSNKIKQAVDNLKATYNTNNPFVICDHLGITVRERNFNESRKAYFVSIYGQPSITINSNYIEKSKNILCAHELGHIILGHTGVNNFESENQEAETFFIDFICALPPTLDTDIPGSTAGLTPE